MLIYPIPSLLIIASASQYLVGAFSVLVKTK